MSNLTIRPWKESDLQAVRDIAWKSWRATYASFIQESDLLGYLDEHYTLDSLRKLFRTENAVTFIAEIEAEPVGFAKTYLNPEDGRFYVASLYLLPGFQGKGIGGHLMKASEKQALTLGADEIWLGVMNKNTSALEWYRRIGFQFVQEAPFTMGSTTVNHLIGYKKIDRSEIQTP